MIVNTVDQLFELIDEMGDEVIKFDGLDAAIVGVGQVHGQPPRLVYSSDAIIRIFMEEGMSEEDAIEHFEFNVACAYVGEATPLILSMELGKVNNV
jgi:hypothetical protein